MDKIWYRNPSKSEVIGRCDGDEKLNDHAEPTKVERIKKNIKKTQPLSCVLILFAIVHSYLTLTLCNLLYRCNPETTRVLSATSAWCLTHISVYNR